MPTNAFYRYLVSYFHVCSSSHCEEKKSGRGFRLLQVPKVTISCSKQLGILDDATILWHRTMGGAFSPLCIAAPLPFRVPLCFNSCVSFLFYTLSFLSIFGVKPMLGACKLWSVICKMIRKSFRVVDDQYGLRPSCMAKVILKFQIERVKLTFGRFYEAIGYIHV